MPNGAFDEPVAIEGGPPVFPEGAPSWPMPDDDVRDMLMSTCAGALWGKYAGPFTTALCTALRELHDIEYVLPCCSGTFAVELALRAVGVRADDEVILAGYDFPGNFRAIEAVGAMPVLADIDPRTWCLDVHQFGRQETGSGQPLVGTRTRALIVSHLHGGLAEMQQLGDVARSHGVAIVEDACQAHGAYWHGRAAGAWGDVGVLSFGGSKLLSAGRGGAILTNDPHVYQRAKIHVQRGNDAFPLSELQAAVLLPQISKLRQRNASRRTSVQLLRDACGDMASLELVHVDEVRGSPSYYKVAFRYAGPAVRQVSRDQILAALTAEGLDMGPGFRGFARRGPRRCRKVGPLTHSAAAAEETFLLHHPVLLESPAVIGRVALALHKVIRWCDAQSPR
jgi:perosamine synthetase